MPDRSRSPSASRAASLALAALLGLAGCEARGSGSGGGAGGGEMSDRPARTGSEGVAKSEAEWRRRLTPEQYRVLREKGTEAPWTGRYEHETRAGVYRCAACGAPLFHSDAKYDSGCGWPAFFEPLEAAAVTETIDTSHDMVRTEITCTRCGSHLGHVFDRERTKTGLRYCVNSVSLDLEPDGAPEDDPKREPTSK